MGVAAIRPYLEGRFDCSLTETEPMASDYARIERALAFIATHVADQPDLDQIAGELGLSPHHFQRLFTRWVGVSPKNFLQYLTLERAKTVLEEFGERP